MKPIAQVDSERRAAILARAPIIPKGACHYCAWPFQGKELWCCSDCHSQYEAEKAAILAASVPVSYVLKR